MNIKTVTTGVLILFTVISIGFLVEKSARNEEKNNLNSSKQTEKVETNVKAEKKDNTKKEKSSFIAYYFHGKFRCSTCRKMEKYIGEVIKNEFSKQLKSGLLQFKGIDVETPENKHFIKEYEIFTKTLILSEIEGKYEARWKNLDKIWDLVSDETKFKNYVKKEINKFMRAS